MEEKILNTRKNGMAMLLLTLLGYVASIALFIYSITLLNADRMLLGVPLLILSIAYWIARWSHLAYSDEYDAGWTGTALKGTTADPQKGQ